MKRKVNKRETVAGFVTFLTTLLLAVYQDWSVTDLLWSLWISSLLLGYLYLITPLFGMVQRGDEWSLFGGRSKSGPSPPAAVMNIFFLIIIFFIFGFH